MQYYHRKLGRTVTVIQCFDSHWNYYEDEAQTIIKQGLPGIDLVSLPEETASVQPIDESDFSEPPRVVVPTEPPAKPVDPQTTKLIYDRKPTSGYQSFEQFQEINSDLDLDWERVKSSMTFPSERVPNEFGTVSRVEVVKVNINTSSITEIANALPGVGKAAAKKIESRRKDGYKDFEQFQQINKDLNLSELAWEKVKELVEF